MSTERDPDIRLDRELDIKKVGECGVEWSPSVPCLKPKGHDQPYYHYFDYGQWGEYDDKPTSPWPSDLKHAFEWTVEPTTQGSSS